MGHYNDSRGVSCFRPDDTPTEFYIDAHYNAQRLGTIIEMAKKKWGNDIDLDELKIEPEHIHTEALGYDRYDSSDYTNYLRVEYDPS